MHKITMTPEIVRQLLIQAPVLAACSLGLFFAIRFWRKAPIASLWTVGGFSLAMINSLLAVYAYLANKTFVATGLVLFLRAATYVLLLVGVYAGRSDSMNQRSRTPRSLWQPVIILICERPWMKGVFRTAFVSTFLLGLVWTAIWSATAPETFAATTRVNLEGDATADADDKGGVQFIQTECEIIQSDLIFQRVADDPKLNLKELFSAKFYGGETVTTAQACEFLKRCIVASPIRGTTMIEIVAYSDNPEDTAQFANAIAENFSRYHLDKAQNMNPQASASKTVSVEIVDRANPNPKPVRPKQPEEFILGLWGSLWLALFMGMVAVVAVLIAEKKGHLAPARASIRAT